MTNKIVIDLIELSKQQDAICNSNLDENIKEGLNNLLGTIQDVAEEYNQFDKANFILEVV